MRVHTGDIVDAPISNRKYTFVTTCESEQSVYSRKTANVVLRLPSYRLASKA